MPVDEVQYYRRREDDERRLADQTNAGQIRILHLDLADRYRDLAQEAQLRQAGQDQGPADSPSDPLQS